MTTVPFLNLLDERLILFQLKRLVCLPLWLNQNAGWRPGWKHLHCSEWPAQCVRMKEKSILVLENICLLFDFDNLYPCSTATEGEMTSTLKHVKPGDAIMSLLSFLDHLARWAPTVLRIGTCNLRGLTLRLAFWFSRLNRMFLCKAIVEQKFTA